ncbi:hypothetical protein [Thermus scotoductus]|uniref:hypothetical protein n=1 Tax=Thermus scotoductus TaxID=37636 RepID=UPI0003A22AF3|nr:hypothetical protein [Thermus scotoductus]
MRAVRLRNKRELVVKILEVLRSDTFLGKALILGYKVLLNREFERFEDLLKKGRVGEAGVMALVLAHSPYAYKLPNRKAPREGWRELVPVVEAVMLTGDVGAVEAAVRLRAEGDEAEVLFLLELLAAEASPGDLRDAVLRLARHLPEDRRHKASEPVAPYVGPSGKQTDSRKQEVTHA